MIHHQYERVPKKKISLISSLIVQEVRYSFATTKFLPVFQTKFYSIKAQLVSGNHTSKVVTLFQLVFQYTCVDEKESSIHRILRHDFLFVVVSSIRDLPVIASSTTVWDEYLSTGEQFYAIVLFSRKIQSVH